MNVIDKTSRIKSFVLRQGRKTQSQQQALELYWQNFGLIGADFISFEELFGNKNPITLEIGFGNGESLAQMAQAMPDQNFLGIEVHSPGVGHLLDILHKKNIQNVRVMREDAVEVLEHMVPDHSLDRVQLFFADPWPKKRHHKRRIVQQAFVELLAKKLSHGGILHMATDWENYAEHMAHIMGGNEHFENTASPGPFSPRPEYRPVTKFEQRGIKLGHGVWDLIYRRK